MPRLSFALLLAAVLTLASSVQGQAQRSPIEIEHGVYILHLLLHPIGREEYTITDDGTPDQTLHTSTTLSDRGTQRTTTSTLVFGPHEQPVSFTQTSRSGTAPNSVPVTSTTQITGNSATVDENGVTRSLIVPPDAFVGFTSMPAAVEMLMMRFWRYRHEPARLPILRASPQALPLEIRQVGFDAFLVHNHMVRLTRYTIANLVWGREIVWMNDSNRLAAVMTFAGGLPQEEILDEYESAADQLFQSAVQQQMLDLAALTHQVPPEAQGTFAIVGAHVIDATGAPTRIANVVVRNNRIASVSSAPAPAGMRIVHAEGQYLLPGLYEMHVHYSGVEFGPALLAQGITTARDCGGEFAFLIALRHAIQQEHALGPRLLLAGLIDSGGPLGFGSIDVKNTGEAVEAVDQYANAHFDQIKVYTQIQPDVLRAITAEAHRRGLTVTGHVPAAVTTFQGVEDGMDQINHLQFVTKAMLPEGSKGPVDPDSPEARRVIAFLKQHNTVVDPTVGWGEMAGHPRSLNVATFEPGILHAPYTLASKFESLGSTTDPAQFRQRMAINLKVVGELFEAGIPIVPGSDTGLPGYGLDRELELYVQAGMTPMQAIQSATIVSARAMRHDADSGTIQAGKRADLILLDADPLANIANLRRVRKVVRDGALYDCAKLHASVGFH